MWLDSESQDAIALFWQLCGEIEPFPRTLERSLALALPVVLIKLPRLKLREVEGWLQRRDIAFEFNCQSRAVRGCLIAFGGQGLIFVDGADPDNERRFTLAHEIAHFMIDYWQPRYKAIKKLGDSVTEVMDGLRPPHINERVQALLASVPIGVHTDLMERGEAYDAEKSRVWTIENRADRIALALLAPPEAVLHRVDLSLPRFEERQIGLKTVLCEQFGLSETIAMSYSRSLLISMGKGPSWVEAMKLR